MAETLVATDLDRTLIYSVAAAGVPVADLVCVETLDGAPISHLTARAVDLLGQVCAVAHVVPVTTRTPEQLARVRLPGRLSRYAIAANGGVLLDGGKPDADWARRVAGAVGLAAPLSEVWAHVSAVAVAPWTLKLRSAADLFCYAVLDRAAVPASFVDDVTGWAAARGWSTSLQGRKLYWIPDGLSKAAAMQEVSARLGSDRVLAAGDSLLDAELLLAADAGVMPAHGELFEVGWRAPSVTVTAASGAVAGEQILEWMLARVGVPTG